MTVLVVLLLTSLIFKTVHSEIGKCLLRHLRTNVDTT